MPAPFGPLVTTTGTMPCLRCQEPMAVEHVHAAPHIDVQRQRRATDDRGRHPGGSFAPMMRMGLGLLSIATFVAFGGASGVACGGASGKPTTRPDDTGGGTATPTGPAFTQWGAVMKVGATWTFDNSDIAADDVTVVEAKVAEVRDVPGGKAIVLAWTENGSPMEVSNMPEVVVVTDANVTIYGDVAAFEQNDAESALVFPAAAEPVKLAGGLYIEKANLMPGFEDDQELCYGWGPEDDAEDCADVCYAHICVDPAAGLTGGDGMWWPNYVPFTVRSSASE